MSQQTGLWGRIRQFFGAPQLLSGASLLSGAAKAQVTLTSDATAPADGDTVTLGATVYTFQSTLTPLPYEVLTGISAATALDNLKSAVNATTGSGTTYAAGTIINPLVTATTNTDTTQLFVAKTAGTAGNAIASTETSAHLAFGTATLIGGTGTTDEIEIPGTYIITCTSIDKPVLFTPVAGQDDGAIVTVISSTAFAHVVTSADEKIYGGGSSNDPGDVLTFAAHAGAGFSLEAYQGLWYVRSLVNVTLSDA